LFSLANPTDDKECVNKIRSIGYEGRQLVIGLSLDFSQFHLKNDEYQE